MSVITLAIVFIGGYMVGEAIGWKRGWRDKTETAKFWENEAWVTRERFYLAIKFIEMIQGSKRG